ncbi:MAG: hypothetical protein ACLFOC_08530 [Campylobacterales bacterium]
MHEIRLNVQDNVFEQFMGMIEIMPKQSIEVMQIDDVPYYPSISYDEACKKVEKSITDISKNLGQPAEQVFKEILD